MDDDTRKMLEEIRKEIERIKDAQEESKPVSNWSVFFGCITIIAYCLTLLGVLWICGYWLVRI